MLSLERVKSGNATMIKLLLNGEEVSHLWVIDFEMRIRTAVVRMGGIAGVWTDERHRLKGYATQVLRDSLRFMKEEGYDVSLLFGIPNFYHRFGYATVLPRYKVFLEAKNLPSEESEITVRPYSPQDKEGVLRIYEENNKGRTGTIVRSPERWEGFSKGSGWGILPLPLVFLRGEELVGYMVEDKEGEAVISDMGVTDRRVFHSMLREIKRDCERKGKERACLVMPPDFPFVEFCQRYEARLEIEFPHNRDGMGRIINLEGLFKKLEGYLGRCWDGKHRGVLSIHTEIGEVSLELREGEVEVLPIGEGDWNLDIPQAKLMQLVMGYRSIDDLLLDGDVLLEGEEGAEILRKFFPRGFAHCWLTDAF